LRAGSATITNLLATTLTVSGGTANGVLYLNGSKVATSGSALTFDGTNLGVAVTPSAWGSIFRAVQVGTGGSIFGRSSGNQDVFQMGANVFWDGSNWKYIGNGASTRYEQATGTHVWSYAASGTAGDTITFTEAMTLNASGNLGIGTSSPLSKLDVRAASAAIDQYQTIQAFSTDSAAIDKGAGLALGGYYSGTSSIAVFGALVGRKENSTAGNFSGYLAFGTNNNATGTTEKMRLDSSGNLGLGVTPSLWSTSYRAFEFGSGSLMGRSTNTDIYLLSNSYLNTSGNFVYKSSAAAGYYSQAAGAHYWYRSTDVTPTAGNTITFTQAMTLDASGNLGIGTSSPNIGGVNKAITVNSATSTNCSYELSVNNVLQGSLFTGISTSSVALYTVANGPLLFGTNNTERARITAGGYSKFSNTGAYQDSAGSYHEFRSNGAAGEYTAIIGNSTSTDANAFGVRILYGNADPNGTGNQFLNCADWNGSSIVTRAEIRSNGGLANYQANNVDLSDARTKKDIIPAASMWGKVSALEIVTYKYNDQTHDDVNLGVIAQQVETVEPVWVDADGFGDTPEDGVPIKTVYTKDITFAAIKALQEAMTRIEQLEAKVAALESK
jgi:hypothetical protein